MSNLPEDDVYQENEYRALLRELDVALNGEEGAARQATLCDLVAQVAVVARRMGRPVFSPSGIEPFVARYYDGDTGPSIKGNGFDGLRVGDTREDTEEFVAWLNAKIAKLSPPLHPLFRYVRQRRLLDGSVAVEGSDDNRLWVTVFLQS